VILLSVSHTGRYHSLLNDNKCERYSGVGHITVDVIVVGGGGLMLPKLIIVISGTMLVKSFAMLPEDREFWCSSNVEYQSCVANSDIILFTAVLL